MASRFQGRDFQTLRQEILDFVRERAPETWDYNNASDPMVRFIESMAMLGDHLNYYIDAMRRESDLATATLASSVYSYALREGYLLTLPRSTHFRVNLFYNGDGEHTSITLNKFDKFNQINRDGDYFVLTPISNVDVYTQYPMTIQDSSNNTVTLESPEIELVSGELNEVKFTFSDIDYYSRIELPDSRIDAEMCQLIATNGNTQKEIIRVEDVISDLAQPNVFSLTPSFVGGVERLYIEFPFNYRNMFPSNTTFVFRYITIKEEGKPLDYFECDSNRDIIGVTRSYGGYRTYENAESVKQNYKNYVRDFSSLVTKQDYKAFVNYHINSRCQVFDKSDQYRGDFKDIPVRTIYILSDLQYKEREALRDLILTRSSRSDNIFMIPYGRKLYRAFIIVEANLMTTNEESIKSTIKSTLSSFYNDISEVRDPIESVIYHKIHSCDEAIKRAWVILISEYDYDNYGNTFSNFPTEEICSDKDLLEKSMNNEIFSFFYGLLPNDPEDPTKKDLSYIDRYSDLILRKEEVIQRNLLLDRVSKLSHYMGDLNNPRSSYIYEYPNELPYVDVNSDVSIVFKDSDSYYDSPDIDTLPVDSDEYKKTHFVLPSLYDLVIWVYPT